MTWITERKFAWLPVMLKTGKWKWLVFVNLVHQINQQNAPQHAHTYYFEEIKKDKPSEFARELKQFRECK